MAIHETKKQSDLEKRLRLLRLQVYGKQKWEVGSVKLDKQSLLSDESKEVRSEKSHIPFQYPTSHVTHLTSKTEVSYLYHDLTKIGILASIALGAQLMLLFLMKNHILNLNLF